LAEISQSHGFEILSEDMKHFVSQLIAGHTKLDDLIALEHRVIQNTNQAQEIINTHISTALEKQRISTVTDNDRKRFLGSFKFPEMNQRFNEIVDPDETFFTRVFASYEAIKPGRSNEQQLHENTSSEVLRILELVKESDRINIESDDLVDRNWLTFTSWLKSQDKLFWIQGKPGSGKSTLLRFLVSNPITQELLNQWQPQPLIISHFLWKSGSPLQNNLKGLFCHLIHEVLSCSQNNQLIDKLFYEYTDRRQKDTTNDWSASELRKLVRRIIEESSRSLAIFIDGLDEISDKDGVPSILDVVSILESYENVKLCVSSRPEWAFCDHLGQVPTLKLHKLMEVDMLEFIHHELNDIPESDCVSPSLKRAITDGLLEKAQGVFLWLNLAIRSIKNGIKNRDTESQLFQRLEKLPSALEDLYADMWQRLNDDEDIYKEQASLYLKLIMNRNERVNMRSDNMLNIAIAYNDNIRDTLLDCGKEIDGYQLNQLCERTRGEILTRCVGLVEIQEQASERNVSPLKDTYHHIASAFRTRPVFIHRTVVDFLTGTEFGKRLLDYETSSNLCLRLRELKACLAMTRVYAWYYGMQSRKSRRDCPQWLDALSHSDGIEEKLPELLRLTKAFYDSDILIWKGHQTPRMPKPDLTSAMAHFRPFVSFVTTSVSSRNDVNFATQVLRDMWHWPNIKVSIELLPEVSFLESLLELGADVLSPGVSLVSKRVGHPLFVNYGSPLALFATVATSFLLNLMQRMAIQDDMTRLYKSGRERIARAMMQIANCLAKACSHRVDETHRTLILLEKQHAYFILSPIQLNIFLTKGILLPYGLSTGFTIVLDVSVFSLVSYAIRLGTSLMSEKTAPSSKNLFGDMAGDDIIARYAIITDQGEIKCYRFLEQDTITYMVNANMPGFYEEPVASCELPLPGMGTHLDSRLYERVDLESAIYGLAKEKKGFISLEDAGIHLPDEDSTSWMSDSSG
jgi:hypothetical protein